MSTFEIIWYGQGGDKPALRRICGRTEVNRKDLTAAITAAANLIKHPRGDAGAREAHGFFVWVVR